MAGPIDNSTINIIVVIIIIIILTAPHLRVAKFFRQNLFHKTSYKGNNNKSECYGPKSVVD